MSGGVPQAFTRLREDARRELAAHRPRDAAQDALRTRYLDHLEAEPGAVWRDGAPVHLTASVLLLDDAGERVLLTLHRKAGLWLQVGGHLEAQDASLRAGALREAREESGLERIRLSAGPVDLHAHLLSAAFGRCAEHLDVRWAGWAEPGAQPALSEESDDLAWWPVDALPPLTDPDLPVLVRAAQASPPGGAG